MFKYLLSLYILLFSSTSAAALKDVSLIQNQVEKEFGLQIFWYNEAGMASNYTPHAGYKDFSSNMLNSYSFVDSKKKTCSIFLRQPHKNQNDFFEALEIKKSDLYPQYQNITDEDLMYMTYVHEITHCRHQAMGFADLNMYQKYLLETQADMASYFWAVLNKRYDLADFWLYSRMLFYAKYMDMTHNTSTALAEFSVVIQKPNFSKKVDIKEFYKILDKELASNKRKYSPEQFYYIAKQIEKSPKDSPVYDFLRKDVNNSSLSLLANREKDQELQTQFFLSWISLNKNIIGKFK